MTFIVDFMLGVTVGALYYCDFTVKFNVNSSKSLGTKVVQSLQAISLYSQNSSCFLN